MLSSSACFFHRLMGPSERVHHQNKKLTGRPRKHVGFALERLHERGPDLSVAPLCCGRVCEWGSELGEEREFKRGLLSLLHPSDAGELTLN